SKDVVDHAVLARRVERLKDDQHRALLLAVQGRPKLAKLLAQLFRLRQRVLLGHFRIHGTWVDFVQFHFGAWLDDEPLAVFMFHLVGGLLARLAPARLGASRIADASYWVLFSSAV